MDNNNNHKTNYVLIPESSEPNSKKRIHSSSIYKGTQKTTISAF
jgi:hypothetical protein